MFSRDTRVVTCPSNAICAQNGACIPNGRGFTDIRWQYNLLRDKLNELNQESTAGIVTARTRRSPILPQISWRWDCPTEASAKSSTTTTHHHTAAASRTPRRAPGGQPSRDRGTGKQLRRRRIDYGNESRQPDGRASASNENAMTCAHAAAVRYQAAHDPWRPSVIVTVNERGPLCVAGWTSPPARPVRSACRALAGPAEGVAHGRRSAFSLTIGRYRARKGRKPMCAPKKTAVANDGGFL